MKTNDIYRMALREYGAEMQYVVAIEELSELQKEICKLLRGGGDLNCLAEEIADVKIMTEQLTLIFGCKEAVNEWRQKKLERLERRLANAGSGD